jgi:cysteine synthase A
MALYDNILGTVGNTPIVRINRLAPEGVNLYAKVEAFNPLGSVKDRLALGVIEAAERSGELKPGQTVIEATSGNTGIGLAMVCAAKGYPLVIVMAESFSVERRRLMRFLGAKVVLTPAALKGSGMLAKAAELAKAHGWFLTRQFENEVNADTHTNTTAQEILRDFEGRPLDYWVTGVGTGGTLKGVARALRDARPQTKIIAYEPDNVPIMASGVPQPAPSASGVVSHPHFYPHPIQGVTADFISKLTSDALAQGLVDEIMPVSGGDALRLSRELAYREGIFAGISSGAAIAAALNVAKRAPAGSTILCMLPDTGERYLSTPLFEDVPADMTPEEIEISQSTASARFGAPAPAPAALPAPTPVAAPVAATAPVLAPAPPAADPQAEAMLQEMISDPSNPVVMFALEWCEFCWSVGKLFAALNVPYRPVELDSFAMQDEALGQRVRRALAAKTGANTLPQVFINGEYVGGGVDTFDAFGGGSLQTRLAGVGISPKAVPGLKPYDLLPRWMQPTG